MNRERDILTDMAYGALAGVAATWVLDKVTTLLYERQDEEASKREQEVMEGRTAYGVAAENAAGMMGRQLSEKQRKKYGTAVHWALGAGSGAAYAALRRTTPWASLGFGTLYGVLFWLVVDEGANTALGLTPPPQEFPWETHARGLMGHIAYGVAAEAAMQLGEAV